MHVHPVTQSLRVYVLSFTGILRGDTYTTVNDAFYCKTHYDELFKKAGGYDFGKVDESAVSVKGE